MVPKWILGQAAVLFIMTAVHLLAQNKVFAKVNCPEGKYVTNLTSCDTRASGSNCDCGEIDEYNENWVRVNETDKVINCLFLNGDQDCRPWAKKHLSYKVCGDDCTFYFDPEDKNCTGRGEKKPRTYGESDRWLGWKKGNETSFFKCRCSDWGSPCWSIVKKSHRLIY